jgi:hypothetical protein
MVVSQWCFGEGEHHAGKDCFDLFLKSKNLAVKTFLVFDKSPGHPQDLCVAHPNMQVECPSKTTTSPQQQLDQGMITTFKTNYTRHTFRSMLHARKKESVVSLIVCAGNGTA